MTPGVLNPEYWFPFGAAFHDIAGYQVQRDGNGVIVCGLSSLWLAFSYVSAQLSTLFLSSDLIAGLCAGGGCRWLSDKYQKPFTQLLWENHSGGHCRSCFSCCCYCRCFFITFCGVMGFIICVLFLLNINSFFFLTHLKKVESVCWSVNVKIVWQAVMTHLGCYKCEGCLTLHDCSTYLPSFPDLLHLPRPWFSSRS